MNQLCKVCGEPAAGFHFGAFTCEGCKSFFGRTYNNISAIAGCKNNGDCVINKKNRTACKACRLRKCLLVGMSKSGSRYGRRSNWFKIHCLLQEQQTQTAGPGGGGSGGGGGSIGGGSNFEQLARLHQIHARQTYQDKTNPCIKSAASLSPPTVSLPALSSNSTHGRTQHDFLSAAKFLNGMGVGVGVNVGVGVAAAAVARQAAASMIKPDTRLSDTPSDSGASSAGEPADDCGSNASGLQQTLRNSERSCSSAHQTESDDADERDRRRKQFLQIFRSQSEPLRSPFAPFAAAAAYSNLPPPNVLSSTSPAILLPAFKEQIRNVNEAATTTTTTAEGTHCAPLELQEEPIDLSFKSNETQSSQTPRSHQSSVSGSSTPTPAPDELPQLMTKPSPLDLTLVRPQTLTG